MNNENILQYSGFGKKIFILLFVVIVLEGAIRKWFFINSEFLLIGFRDFLVLTAILYGFKNKIFNFSLTFEKIASLWTFLVLIWIFVQLIFKDLEFIVALIGLRNWVLYLWLSLFFYKVLNLDDLKLIFKFILLTIVPISILSVTQHFLPLEHFLNKQAGNTYIFRLQGGDLYDDVVRTTGTFSFNSSYSYYLMFLCPLVYFLAIGEKVKNSNIIFNLCIFVSFFLAVLTSGSRLTISYSIVMMFPFIVSLILKKNKKQILSIIFFSLIAIFIANNFFYKAIDITKNRYQTGSYKTNDTDLTLSGRLLEINFGTKETWSNLNFFGNGIGKGSNSARIFLNDYSDFIFGETEMQKILKEGGVLGITFIIVKILFIIFLIKAYQIRNKINSLLPFIYWFYIILNFSLTSYSSQITAHAFSYLALSIGLILLKDNFLSRT
tara:strand:- start:377 stop:1687 length:1311 start_codon:yes stop_codon:yes gene_type:complete